MKRKTLLNVALFCLVLTLATQVSAQPQRRGLYGDWLVKSEFNGRTMESILAFSRDADGNQTGQWISFWGASDLKDVKFEDGQISFARVRQNRDGQTRTSTFKGTIAEGKLSGMMSGGQREYALAGARAPRTPRAVGSWEMKLKREEREFNATLTITADKDGALAGTWKSERGEMAISDVQSSRRELSFTLKSTNPDRQWETKFEGTIGREGLSGTFKSERGEMTAEGTRMGAAAIGTWNLEVTSDRGTRKQRLRINPDMSALYGSMVIKKIDFENDQMSFKVSMTFGEREFEMSFQGKLQDAKLAGELTTSMGNQSTQKVTGTKVIRRRRPSM
jgi:hypothetical protein